MAHEHVPGGDCAGVHRSAPPVLRGGEVDFGEDEVNKAGKDRLFIGYVVVDRHRLDPNAVSQLSHGERVGAFRISKFEGCSEHSIASDGGAFLR